MSAAPRSATPAWVCWIGLAAMLGAVALLNAGSVQVDMSYQALLVMGATALGIFVPDLLGERIDRRALVGAGRAQGSRVLAKAIGLLTCVGFIALLYWLFPEYHGSFYDRYWRALEAIALPWAVLAVPYLAWVDARMAEPEDGLWQVGRAVLGQRQGLSARVVGQTLLGWLVKGYFLPLMFVYFCGNLDELLHWNLPGQAALGALSVRLPFATFPQFFDWLYFVLYFIDVGWVSMTYLMSLRLFDTHLRSTEPTMLGWVVALICYQPFQSLIGGQYLAYDAGRPWGEWLAPFPAFYGLWGVLILALVVVYVWATISFGARFSNLTHRGIITNGPYRYVRHPAYLAKNLSWWLISLPFLVSHSATESLRRSLLLLALNAVYYLRAKTEERHLMRDAQYAAYSAWIDEHGALRELAHWPLVGALIRWRLAPLARPVQADPVLARPVPPALTHRSR